MSGFRAVYIPSKSKTIKKIVPNCGFLKFPTQKMVFDENLSFEWPLDFQVFYIIYIYIFIYKMHGRFLFGSHCFCWMVFFPRISGYQQGAVDLLCHWWNLVDLFH